MVETTTHFYGWTKPEPGHSATTWGTFLNADLDSIDSHLWTINSQVNINALTVARAADGGSYGTISFNNNGNTQPRWIIYEDSTTESGSNAGSNFGLNAYSDTGAYLGNAFTIVRATQNVTFGQSITVNGAINCATFGSSPTFTGNVTFNGSATCSYFGGSPTFGGSVTVNGNVAIGSNLTVYGSFSIAGFAATNATITNLNIMNGVDFAINAVGLNQFLINAGSNDRYMQFAPNYVLHFQPSTGLLYWNTPGGPGGTEWAPFQVSSNGNLFIAGTLTQGSDIALKENVTPFDADPLAIIQSIMPKRFTRKATPDQREIGFVAQDVQSVLPEAVREGDDGMLGIAETPLVAVLWRAVQELARRVQELEAR